MIKKSMLISISLLAVVGLIVALMFIYPAQKNDIISLETKNVMVFSGFNAETNIELTYANRKNINVDHFMISDNTHKILDVITTPFLDLKISNGNTIYDIQTRTKNKKVFVAATGLEQQSKILLKTKVRQSNRFIPVDWAGQIELFANSPDNNFCILIQQKYDASICYHTQEVTS